MRVPVPRSLLPGLILSATLVAQAGSQPDLQKQLDALMAKVEAAPNGKKPKALTEEVEAFVAAHPATDAALTCKLWLLRECWWEREAGTMQESADRRLEDLLAHHAGSKLLWKIADSAFLWTGLDGF